MVRFTHFQSLPKIPKTIPKGQKFQSRDKIPKSESRALHPTQLISLTGE